MLQENTLYDVRLEGLYETALLAASDNILFTVNSPAAAAAAVASLGTREYYIAPFDVNGVAAAASFVLLARLRSGDTTPTPEAVTEDTTYDNGVVVSNQTGVNNGTKTWDVEGSADEPVIALLIDHSRVYGTPEKRGKPLAYVAFNEDRSSFSGALKVNTATVPREGSQRWTFTVAFETVELRRPAQNPVAGGTGVPAVADLTPTSGPIGTSISITGVNLLAVTEARLGAQVIGEAAFTTNTDGRIAFAVPTGATVGQKVVDLVYAGGEVFAGYFTVT